MTGPAACDRPAFSRPLLLRDVPEEGLRETVTATPEEAAAVAAQIGLPAIAAIEGRFRIQRAGPAGLHVTGAVRGRLRQTCVVSLEDFESTVEGEVDVAFAPPAAIKPRPIREEPQQEVFRDLSEPDEPDPLIDGKIDLGVVASEFLALALDPYPRKPGVVFSEPAPEDAGESSPFAALARLKGEGDGGSKR